MHFTINVERDLNKADLLFAKSAMDLQRHLRERQLTNVGDRANGLTSPPNDAII